MCLLAICISSLRKYLFRSSDDFLIRLKAIDIDCFEIDRKTYNKYAYIFISRTKIEEYQDSFGLKNKCNVTNLTKNIKE